MIKLGDKSPLSNDYFFEVNGELFLASHYYKILLFPSINVFRDSSLFSKKSQKITVFREGKTISFDEIEGKWSSKEHLKFDEEIDSYIKGLIKLNVNDPLRGDVVSKISEQLKLVSTWDDSFKKIKVYSYKDDVIIHFDNDYYRVHKKYLDYLDPDFRSLRSSSLFSQNISELDFVKINGEYFKNIDGLFIAENGRAIENVKNKLFELRYARIEDELTEVPSGFQKISEVLLNNSSLKEDYPLQK